ncbi:MAG: idi [Gammaproteobacteria bacterium]|jgi:isopentenyl-diphosphate delta-isomerase type 1|nr:idi [Gammaproteobacteria bacterium]MCE3238281.1 idi [Gammaproteobacteria bacterium]
MAATEHIILVDENDNPIGTAEKLQAHREGLRHRAFSIFVFSGDHLLLQQRAKEKYHSPELWTNTCCSHPREGETVIEAGQRRLKEEMGLNISLQTIGWFHYIAHFSNGLTENEVDHILIGTTFHREIIPNPLEVLAYRWITLPELEKELADNPERFTPWLKQALKIVKSHKKAIH